jgi:hypothetical protein
MANTPLIIFKMNKVSFCKADACVHFEGKIANQIIFALFIAAIAYGGVQLVKRLG